MRTTKPRRKKSKLPSDIRRYWKDKTLKECEAIRNAMSLAQNHCCAICKRPEAGFTRRLSIDHSHVTGRVRGLLCFQCNKFKVGRFTLDTILPVFEYLANAEDAPWGGS